MRYLKATWKITRVSLSIFGVAHEWYQIFVALLVIAGLGSAFSYFGKSGGLIAILACLLALVFLAAVRTQVELDRIRHASVLEIDIANSQISAERTRWKSTEDDRSHREKIREATLEVALKINFLNKSPQSVVIKDFAISLHRGPLFLQWNKVETNVSYALRELRDGSKPIQERRLVIQPHTESPDYYFFVFVAIPSGMGSFLTRHPKKVLLFYYRVDDDPNPHGVKIGVNWDRVREPGLHHDTVLGYRDIC